MNIIEKDTPTVGKREIVLPLSSTMGFVIEVGVDVPPVRLRDETSGIWDTRSPKSARYCSITRSIDDCK